MIRLNPAGLSATLNTAHDPQQTLGARDDSFDQLIEFEAAQTRAAGALSIEPVIHPVENEYAALSATQRWFRRRLLEKAETLRSGLLFFVDCEGEHAGTAASALLAEKNRSSEFNVTDSRSDNLGVFKIHVYNPKAYRMIATSGELGFADALVMGMVHCERLTDLVRLLIRNLSTTDQMGRQRWSLRLLAGKIQHWLRRNSRKNSRRNIAAHYDLSNSFFRLWLDSTMSYSSGVFSDLKGATPKHPVDYLKCKSSMQSASEEKLRRLCEKLELKPGDRVVEIGCGWGGFAIYAAKNYGCHVTGVTLSEQQLKYAQDKVLEFGLNELIDLQLKDYRDLDGQFDKLVSVEMIEAVGHQYMDEYFKKCCSLLKPNGRMVIQAITIAENRLASYLKNVDFIREYIFPGGSLPSVGSMLTSVAKNSDFRPTHLEDIGLHYAETLRRWRVGFHKSLKSILELGFDDRFLRMWDYYFAYCEGAFEEGHIGTVQMVLDRPGNVTSAVELSERLSLNS